MIMCCSRGAQVSAIIVLSYVGVTAKLLHEDMLCVAGRGGFRSDNLNILGTGIVEGRKTFAKESSL